MFAVVACAVAIPAALPQPESAVATGPIVGIQERSALEKRQIGAIEAGPEQAQDLKGSSSYGYGYNTQITLSVWLKLWNFQNVNALIK